MTSSQSTRPAKIGLMLPAMEKNNGMSSWADIRAMAELAEGIGFDSLWVVDHFLYKLENDDPPKGAWECWSMLSALAACTKNVELGTLVLGMGFRNPALLAKMADTVDEALALLIGTGSSGLAAGADSASADPESEESLDLGKVQEAIDQLQEALGSLEQSLENLSQP